jgi:hypothetical protein
MKVVAQDEVTSNKDFEKIRHNKEVMEAKRYEDENIAVYEGVSKSVSQKLGRGPKYNLCISLFGKLNLFRQYRIRDNQTTYFVYFKNVNAKHDHKSNQTHPSPFILIDVLPYNDGYQWNPVQIYNDDGEVENQNFDYNIKFNELISKFPVLKKPFEENVFQWKDVSLDTLIQYPTYAYKYARDRDFNVDQKVLDAIEPEKAYEYAKYNMFNVNQKVIDIFIKNPKYAYEYARTKKFIVDQKISDAILKDLKYAFDFARNKHFEVDQKFIDAFLKDPLYAFLYARNKDEEFKFKGVQKFIDVFIQDPECAYEYAKAKGFDVKQKIIDSFIQNPEYAFKYAKAKGFE